MKEKKHYHFFDHIKDFLSNKNLVSLEIDMQKRVVI